MPDCSRFAPVVVLNFEIGTVQTTYATARAWPVRKS
jgi:hypothetical protein